MNDARGLAVTSGSAECVAALDRTAESYLGFRADMGVQVNAAVEADPGAPLPQVMKGYLSMLLSNANALGMVDACLNAARANRRWTANSIGALPRSWQSKISLARVRQLDAAITGNWTLL